jgi:hypothetical protein
LSRVPGRPARTVLRGPGHSNVLRLPDREIRMCKLRIKVSGSMRSPRGASEFRRIRSYLQTTQKHGIGRLTAPTDAMLGIPWTPTNATA